MWDDAELVIYTVCEAEVLRNVIFLVKRERTVCVTVLVSLSSYISKKTLTNDGDIYFPSEYQIVNSDPK